MEIADHLRRAGRWSWLLVVLPILSAAAAFAALPQQPTQWTSTATVLTAPTVTARTGAQYINDFQAALRSGFVVDEVAQQSGLSTGDVAEGLASEPLASGSTLVEVSFTSADKQAAETVPRLAAQLALQTLIQPQIDADQAQIAIASKQYSEALRSRETFTDKIGITLPRQAYQSGLAELASLRNSAEVARLEERDSAAGLRRQLEKRTAEVATLAPQATQYDLLQNDVERTYNELNRLRFSLAATQAQLEATNAEGTVTPGTAFSRSGAAEALRPILTAAVAGLVLAALMIAGVLVLFRRRTVIVERTVPAEAAAPEALTRPRDTPPAPPATEVRLTPAFASALAPGSVPGSVTSRPVAGATGWHPAATGAHPRLTPVQPEQTATDAAASESMAGTGPREEPAPVDRPSEPASATAWRDTAAR